MAISFSQNKGYQAISLIQFPSLIPNFLGSLSYRSSWGDAPLEAPFITDISSRVAVIFIWFSSTFKFALLQTNYGCSLGLSTFLYLYARCISCTVLLLYAHVGTIDLHSVIRHFIRFMHFVLKNESPIKFWKKRIFDCSNYKWYSFIFLH